MRSAWAVGGALAGVLVLQAQAESPLGEYRPDLYSQLRSATSIVTGVVIVPPGRDAAASATTAVAKLPPPLRPDTSTTTGVAKLPPPLRPATAMATGAAKAPARLHATARVATETVHAPARKADRAEALPPDAVETIGSPRPTEQTAPLPADAVEVDGLPWKGQQTLPLPAGAVEVAGLPWLAELTQEATGAAPASQPAAVESALEAQVAAIDQADMGQLRGRGVTPGPMAAAIAPVSGSVAADDSLKGLQVAALDNDELDRYRGRGVVGGNVVFFGLAMVTEVSGPQNFHATAGVNFHVDPSDPSHTSAVQTWTMMSGTPSFDTKGNHVGNMGSPPLQGTGGVGQSIQVAGNDNRGRNDVTLNINAPVALATGSGNGCNICTVSTPSPGSLTPLSVKINVPNLDNSNTAISAIQTIGLQPGAVNGVLQGIQIQTAQSIVHNMLNLNVQVGPGSAINSQVLNLLLHKP